MQKQEQQRTMVIGHRGAKKYAPENTIPSFQKAIDLGADGFELDTMLSSDGIPVVIHDRSLARTTDGSGYVDRKNIKELMRLDAGSWFSESYRGIRIPLLNDVLHTFGNQTLINIELKNIHSPFDQLPEKVCNLVFKNNLVKKIIFSSFVPLNLIRIQKIIPKAKLALLISPDLLGKILSIKTLSWIAPDFIHPHYTSCSDRFITYQHAMGRKINAWTVNGIDLMDSLIRKRIDGIITDDPRHAIEVRDRIFK